VDVQPYVARVQEQLAAAADLGDETTQRVAATLTRAAEPAIRLALLAALSAALDDVTVALLDLPGSPALSVRMVAEGVEVDVHPAPSDPEPLTAATNEDDYSARVSLRLPEALKTQVDEAARREGLSVNTWLVRSIGRSLATSSRHHGAQRLTGWVTG
jgi:uncharacterized protein (DUF1778 family)